MPELFDIPETLSPRLKFLQDNCLRVELDRTTGKYVCYSPSGEWGLAAKEDDAIWNYCTRNKVKHFSE